MGASQSNLSPEEAAKFSRESGFTTAQVQRLYNRFQRLDRNQTGLISSEDLMSIPELAMNPLVERIIQIFNRDNQDEDGVGVAIDFGRFLSTLAVFLPVKESSRANDLDDDEFRKWAEDKQREKLKFVFHIYDVEGDGFIDAQELFAVLKMMVTDGISDAQLSFIVDQTIKEADGDGDGKISFDEFAQILAKTDIDSRMTIRF
eukprot:TRINITY_DN8829_c0_g1_i2.p1 TRINITY_DN8829_c0_g1~~TRINITY_DN8829_c0_g1_i2.p1  ORF type:complete len:203 (+),score=50.82 TRINITY_DN8829_c0_g1_i2:105-713(+)